MGCRESGQRPFFTEVDYRNFTTFIKEKGIGEKNGYFRNEAIVEIANIIDICFGLFYMFIAGEGNSIKEK